jgi:N-acetylgalactosamine-6-sulfatase
VETLQGNGKALREKPLFWKTIAPWPARKTKPDHWVSYAVVSKNWKLVANRDAGYVELYDLVTDPLEKNDLKEKHPKVVKELTKTLEQWQTTLPPEPTGNVFSNLRNPKK